jgi:hypothetical protein
MMAQLRTSILVSTLLDELSSYYTNANSAYCYHCCDYTDHESLDIIVILGSLIKQLLGATEISKRCPRKDITFIS